MSTGQKLIFQFLTTEGAKEFFLSVVSNTDNLVVGHPDYKGNSDTKSVSVEGERINYYKSLIVSLYQKVKLTESTNTALEEAERLDEANQPDEAQKLRDEARKLASKYASLSMDTADTIPSP